MVLRAKQNAHHTWEMNWGPGQRRYQLPCMRKTWETMSSAVSLAEGSPGSATKWAAFENRSIMVKMVVLPLDGGRPVTNPERCRTMDDWG